MYTKYICYFIIFYFFLKIIKGIKTDTDLCEGTFIYKCIEQIEDEIG